MNAIKIVISFLKLLIRKRKQILTLAVIDFKEKHLGSYLGVIWVILRPLLFVGVVWLVFSIGIKGEGLNSDSPFVVYLLTGYVPWMFFSGATSGAMNSIISNKYLLKRMFITANVLPVIKIVSSLFLHGAFLLVLFVFMACYGMYPSVYWLQLPYYVALLTLLLFGLGLLTSSLRVFVKDVREVVAVVMQFGFWVTPIFWSLDAVPKDYEYLLNINPMIYIINGYRNTFISHIWFWEDGRFLLSFLLYTVVVLIAGIVVFKKTKPHFGDVL